MTKAVFEAVADHLEARGTLLRGGTIVDATLIAASPSTKNAAGQRDPEMRSSKKGNQWHFGMKAHIGVDACSGLVHTAGVTSGSVHDATVMDLLIRADDTAVYGDKGSDRVSANTRIPCFEMPIWLPQGALSRPRKERRATVLAAGARQSLPRSQDTCVRVSITRKKTAARHRLASEPGQTPMFRAIAHPATALITVSLGLTSHTGSIAA